MPVSDFDVLIVGGGLAGLSLACALRDSRLRLALVEQHPPRPTDGWDARVYAISPANRSFLQEIGIWKHLPGERLSAIHAMKIHGDRGAELDFSAYETGIDELGWILESSLMACELWENAKRQGNLSLFCPAVPVAVEIGDGTASLTIGDDRRITARLLVAADGRDSWVRGKVGLRAIDTPYGELGLVANFDCQTPHRGVARQWFRHDGVLAWLPLAGDRISIVWSAPEELAHRLLDLPPDALAGLNLDADQLGQIEELGIQAINVQTSPQGLAVTLNGNALPLIRWDGGQMENLVALGLDGGALTAMTGADAESLDALRQIGQFAPLLQTTPLNISVVFPE